MSSTINASSAGIVETADSSGTLQLQTGGQSALYIDASQNITIPKNLTVQGTLTFSGGGGGAVTTVSGGSTGLTPSTPASGNVVLGGTLNVVNGGTGVTTSTGSGSVVLSASPTFTGTLNAAAISATGAVSSTFGGGYSALQSNAVGIGASNTLISNSGSGFTFSQSGSSIGSWSSTFLAPVPDNTQSLGLATNRWTTVYATTGTINTSDANQKQQIQDFTPAEIAVGKALKPLLKTFKFNDSVSEKGTNARIHIGIIAQDVQAAFTAQGLNPDNYGVFCSDTWYEVDGKVLDEEGNKYMASAAGAVEFTRLGIRYDELLAFIIAGL